MLDPPIRRPLPLTIIAIIIAISFLFLPFTLAKFAPIYMEAYGPWYMGMWITSLAATAAIAVSFWRMESWGLYVYTGMFVLGTIVGVLAELPFTVSGVVVPMAIIAAGFAYLPRRR